MSNKIIQSMWWGKLTAMERLCIRSFMANGHEFHLYTYEPLEGVPEGCVVKDASEIVPLARRKEFKYIQQFGDYFRYVLLAKNGGWWVDMDVVCLKPFDFTEDYVFVESTGDKQYGLNFAVIKVPEGSPLVKACLDYANGTRNKWEKMEFQAIGPDLWARKVHEFNLSKFIKPIEMFDPIRWNRLLWSIDPTKQWDLSQCHALHLFHAAWNKGSQAASLKGNILDSPNTDGTFPEECLYEQLKKRFLHPPKVTVVVTTINRATQLRKTFESFVRQNFNDYEVVVIDDGTDTETPALCAELWPFPLRYFRLDRLRSPEYHNQSVVANYGVRQAYGEIVILQCAECLHVGNVLSDLTNRVTPNNVVLCRADHLNQDGTVNAEKTDYMNIVRERMALFFCGAIYKSWFCKLRGFDERYERFYGADDIDFSDRLRFSGLEFEYLTDSFVQHQWHPIPAMTAEGGKSFRDSQKEAHEFLVKTTADMKAGRIGPIRNLDKEWGQIVNISIVITTYNRPVLLRDTLASINRQGIRNLEIVVVDDGTDNETQEICKQFNATYIKICRPQTAEYRNPARPINIGIRHARGNVILLQNAECVHVDPNTIEKLTRAVTDKNAVFARVTGMKQDGTPDILYCGKEYRRAFFFCGAIKKAWFEKLRGFDEDYTKAGYDDNDFADRLEKEGVQFEFSDIEVHHKWHPRVQTAVSFEPMAALYQQKTAAMAAGRLGTIRNLDREWGALEENSVMAPAAREVSFVDPKGSYWGPKADLPNTTAFDPGGLKSAPTAREVARPSPSLVKPKLALVMATGDLASFRNFQLNAQKFEPHTRKVLVYSGAQEVGNVEGWQIVNGSGNYLDDLNLAIQTAAPDDVLICAPTLRFTANQTSTWLQSVAVKNRRIGVLSPKIQGGAGVQGHPILPAHLTTNPWSVVTSGQSLDPLCLFMLRDVLRYFENGLQDADISRAVKGIGLISAVTPHKTVAHA